MALSKLWIIAYRDLMRNRRRSFFSLLAVALGLALLIVLNGFIAGILEDAIQNTIRLRTGHVQVRAESYQEEKRSLQWRDLLADPEDVTARATELDQVESAAPVLWTNGVLNTVDDSAGLQVYGIDPTAGLYAPIRAAMVAGEFLTPDDRSGILLGKRLADSLGIPVGQRVSLTLVDADGQPEEGVFTVRGLFATGVPTYDDSSIFMPLAKAQAFTQTPGRASAVVLLLRQQDEANDVAAALRNPEVATFTWRDLNKVFLETFGTAMRFYVILDFIVMLVVAVVIANTLLMAVFERIRELGILAALGMKRRQIMLMLLLEAAILGLAGIVVGIGLGLAGVWYLATVGFAAGETGSAVENIAMGSTYYARFVPGTFAALSLWTLLIILLASLYPAWYAARLEPVQALHSS